MHQVKSYSDINRHPVKRVVTILFYALIKPEDHPLDAHDKVMEIKWFNFNELPSTFGFDHAKLIGDSQALLRHNLINTLIFDELLPDTFTLNELQTLYESILGEQLDKRNFRKKIAHMDILEKTNKIKKGVKGGPFLYRRKK